MADSLTVTVEYETLKETLTALPARLKPFVAAAARVSADHIANEARARLQRQIRPEATETVASIRVVSDRTGWGWRVVAGKASFPMVAVWLEHGTRHQRARPFLYPSARLEEAAHTRRIEAAIRVGLAEQGFNK